MPLTYATMNEKYTIRKIGGPEDVQRHLKNLGFVVGSHVSVVNSIHGNMIVKVKDTRVALDKELARRIMI